MTVFAVHEVKEDLTSAKRWGDIVYVNHRYINGDEIREDGEPPTEFVKNIQAAAQDFNPNIDWLLIAGDHLQIVMFTAQLAKRYRRFCVLRWDRREQAYFPVSVESS